MLAVLGALAAVVLLGVPALSGGASAPRAGAHRPGPGPARAASTEERVVRMDLRYVIAPDGSVGVVETIDYQFPPGRPRHGIHREIQIRTDLPGEPPRHRLLPFTLRDVTSPTGANTEVREADEAQFRVLRVGSPDERLTEDRHTYRISYRLQHVVNGFPDHQEFYFNPVGFDWDVPIDAVTVQVTGPRPAASARCFQGPPGATLPCAAVAGGDSTFSAAGLGLRRGMSVVAVFPAGTFDSTEPVVRGGRAADGGGPVSLLNPEQAKGLGLSLLSLAVLVPVATVAAMARRFARRGRDAPARVPATLRMTPPDGVEPALAGVVVHERATATDVSATVVDLAVRGHLTLEEVRSRWKKHPDWRLTMVAPQPQAPLRQYERRLLAGLFGTGADEPVLLSELRNHFHPILSEVQRDLLDEATARGWFTANPRTVRQRYAVPGVVLAVVGVLIGGAALVWGRTLDRNGGLSTPLPSGVLLGIGFLIAGAVLGGVGRAMPAKTAAGAQVKADALGFRQFLSTAGSAQMRAEEALTTFTRYLPYAIVFGVVSEWARAFERYAAQAPRDGDGVWLGNLYLASGAGHGGFRDFGDSLSDFTSTAAGTFASTPGASGGSGGGSGGFSGGGSGGGGGGGSW